MSEIPFESLLNRSLQNLKGFWRDIKARTPFPTGRTIHPDLPNEEIPHIRKQMQDCLDAKGGEVSARLRAAELGRAYLHLNPTGRERFLGILAADFGVHREAVIKAAQEYQHAEGGDNFEKECRLRDALIAPRVRLLTQFNDLPEGVKFLVDLRSDLLDNLKSHPEFQPLDWDLKSLLASWVDVGFLELRRISWDSPASLLEKLIAYEAVHEIESWTDLRNRLESDRRCYAFFHPHMPGEPLIFIEVALLDQMAGSIQVLLDTEAPEFNPRGARTAIFYSINNTQKGLRGISFGNFLIKRVVDDLLRDFPRLKQFATLSPAPGFCHWLSEQISGGGSLLTEAESKSIETGTGRDPDIALQAVLADPGWNQDLALAASLETPLLRLCARYLTEAKRGGRPLDPVARFHLGNGAVIEKLNWLGDTSPIGLKRSAGIMVNYGYRLEEIEKNHENHVGTGAVALAPPVRRLLKS